MDTSKFSTPKIRVISNTSVPRMGDGPDMSSNSDGIGSFIDNFLDGTIGIGRAFAVVAAVMLTIAGIVMIARILMNCSSVTEKDDSDKSKAFKELMENPLQSVSIILIVIVLEWLILWAVYEFELAALMLGTINMMLVIKYAM